MQPVEHEQRIVTTNQSRKLNEIRYQWEDGWKCVHEREEPKNKVTLVFMKIIIKDPQKLPKEMKDKFNKVKLQFNLE